MGVVGLNFGSATSGQGFDVTSTVNQIVSNLQSVETPWKNQFTSLQSKDTALSSLGTFISTLSTDLQNLRDFNGVLASKAGSSSDTNVLSLLSANSAAVAGTHEVTVQNLARTSSAATDPSAGFGRACGKHHVQSGRRGLANGACGRQFLSRNVDGTSHRHQQRGTRCNRNGVDQCGRCRAALPSEPDKRLRGPDHDCRLHEQSRKPDHPGRFDQR